MDWDSSVWVCFFCSLRSPSFFSFFLLSFFSLLPFGFFVLFKYSKRKKKNSFRRRKKFQLIEKRKCRGTLTALFFLSNSWTEGRRLPDEDETAELKRATDKQTNERERWAKLTLKRRLNPSFRNNPPRAINSKFEFPIRLKG